MSKFALLSIVPPQKIPYRSKLNPTNLPCFILIYLRVTIRSINFVRAQVEIRIREVNIPHHGRKKKKFHFLVSFFAKAQGIAHKFTIVLRVKFHAINGLFNFFPTLRVNFYRTKLPLINYY